MTRYFTDEAVPARQQAGRASLRGTLLLGTLAVATALLSGMEGCTSRPSAEPPSRPAAAPRFADARLANGIRLRYAEQGDPAGQPVILLHGLTDSWFSWSRVLPLFPAEWRVYALDQRGHGDSDRPEEGYAAGDLAADVVAFMDAKGIRRATLVGHSMGSIVAQHVAALAPERVTRLVLVGPGSTLREMNGAADFEQAVMALADSVPEVFAREFQVSTIHRPLPPEFVDRTVVESLKLPVRVWQVLTAGLMASPATEVSGGRLPTLMFWGSNDAVFSREVQDRLQGRIAGARLIVYPETGHAVHWERPEEFVEDLRGFVEAGAR